MAAVEGGQISQMFKGKMVKPHIQLTAVLGRTSQGPLCCISNAMLGRGDPGDVTSNTNFG